MKRALTIVAALMLPVLAVAAEDTGTPPKPAASAAQDSPMVAAAKRANRKGRKPANVITNETLAKAGGSAHVTTTAQQRPFASPKAYEPPAPTAEILFLRERDAAKRRAAAETAAQARAAANAEKKAAAAAEGEDEEGMFQEDETPPAQTDTAQTATPKPPQR